MEPPSKQTVGFVTPQLNRYKNSLPEVPRQQGHFFFKEVGGHESQIGHTTIGYRVTRIPVHLHDLMAVAMNNIHCFCELPFKLTIDCDEIWITGHIGFSREDYNSTRYRIDEANLNDSLMRTRQILFDFIEEIKNLKQMIKDTIILDRVKDEVAKKIKEAFKNPDLED